MRGVGLQSVQDRRADGAQPRPLLAVLLLGLLLGPGRSAPGPGRVGLPRRLRPDRVLAVRRHQVGLPLTLRRVHLVRQREGEDGAADEDRARAVQRPRRPDGLQPRPDGRGGAGRQETGEGDPRIRLHQGEAGRQQTRYDGAAHHSVRLRADQYAQGGRIQLQAARGDRPRHGERQQRPRQHGARHGGAAAVRQAVQERADDRGQEDERRHGDGEVERDPAAGLVRRYGEEHGGRERDGDHHVARTVHRVQLDQLAQTGLTRPVGVRRLPDASGGSGERGVEGMTDRPARSAERAGFVVRPGRSHLVIVPQSPASRTEIGAGRGVHRPVGSVIGQVAGGATPLIGVAGVRSSHGTRRRIRRRLGRAGGRGAAERVACVARHRRLFLAARLSAIPQNGSQKVRPRQAQRVWTSTRPPGPLRPQPYGRNRWMCWRARETGVGEKRDL